MSRPEPRVAVQPRSVAELSLTLDGIAAVFSTRDDGAGSYDRASLAAEQVLAAYELELASQQSELVTAIPYVEALRGQALCQYIVQVGDAITEAAGPVRALYDAVGYSSEREVRELALVAVDALRQVVDVAESVP